mmetsp:Transcript_597/g.4138  ORF Transcript_597/g.4138 Transcript_597/m.4138 type:complete len:242 (-) Transcript_597:326-1051(-)
MDVLESNSNDSSIRIPCSFEKVMFSSTCKDTIKHSKTCNGCSPPSLAATRFCTSWSTRTTNASNPSRWQKEALNCSTTISADSLSGACVQLSSTCTARSGAEIRTSSTSPCWCSVFSKVPPTRNIFWVCSSTVRLFLSERSFACGPAAGCMNNSNRQVIASLLDSFGTLAGSWAKTNSSAAACSAITSSFHPFSNAQSITFSSVPVARIILPAFLVAQSAVSCTRLLLRTAGLAACAPESK